MLYQIYNAGKFISRGVGQHAVRVIESDELIYVLRGTLSMFEEENSFTLTAGSFLFLRKGRKHGGTAPYPKDLIFFWLHFQDMDDFLATLPQSGKCKEDSFAGIYLQNFLVEQSRVNIDRKILDLLFQLIIQEIRRSSCENIPPALHRSVTPLAGAAKEYLLLHFREEDLTLASTAENLHCNTEYLGRIFRQSFGETFNNMLTGKRLDHACFLLRETSMTVKEIALSSGFHDPGYFHRRFHLHYGQPPSKYRTNFLSCHKNTR